MQEQLLADQARSTPTQPLYHYTDQAALRGILERQEIWCFSHNEQSDKEEVCFSWEILRSVIQEEADKAVGDVRLMLLGLDDMLVKYPLKDSFEFYFFSLSSHHDDAGQWSTYGQEGRGFSIGLSPALFQPDRPEIAQKASENVFVSRVIYGTEPTRARHRRGVQKLAGIARSVIATHRMLVYGRNRQSLLDGLNKSFISSQIIWNCLTAKKESFKHEEETRYILLGTHKAFDEIRKVFSSRTYVDTRLPLTCVGNIAEILIGKHAPAHAEQTVRELLMANGYCEGIPIIRSTVEPSPGLGLL